MDEILRNIWLRGAENTASVWLVYCIMLLSAIGSVIFSGLYTLKNRDAALAAVLVAIAIVAGVVLTAVVPTSPLLGVTGTLFPSPWAHGLFPVLCMMSITVSLTYGLVAGTIHSLVDVLRMVSYGLSRWSWVVILVMTVTFILSVIPS